MDLLRTFAVASMAELAIAGAFVPATEETDRVSRRQHARGHVQVVSKERLDYPVITNWLNENQEVLDLDIGPG